MNGLSKLAGFALATLLLLLNASAAHAGPNRSASCSQSKVIGCVLTTLDGVNVYYNGTDPTSNQAAYAFGYAWQCVELVQRYYAEVYNYPRTWAPLDAYESFDSWGHPSRMIAFPNGSASAPQKGDILVFGPTSFNPYGHVALVKAVGNNLISFVQQNVGDIGEDALPIDSNNDIVTRYPYGAVRGWMRDRSALSRAAIVVPDGPLNSGWARALIPAPILDLTDSLFPAQQPPDQVRPPVALVTPLALKASVPPVPSPTANPPMHGAPPTTGQLLLRNWFGRGDADFTINGQNVNLPQIGAPVYLTLAPGQYTWTYHLPTVESENGSVDVTAGNVVQIEFWQR